MMLPGEGQPVDDSGAEPGLVPAMATMTVDSSVHSTDINAGPPRHHSSVS